MLVTEKNLKLQNVELGQISHSLMRLYLDINNKTKKEKSSVY